MNIKIIMMVVTGLCCYAYKNVYAMDLLKQSKKTLGFSITHRFINIARVSKNKKIEQRFNEAESKRPFAGEMTQQSIDDAKYLDKLQDDCAVLARNIDFIRHGDDVANFMVTHYAHIMNSQDLRTLQEFIAHSELEKYR